MKVKSILLAAACAAFISSSALASISLSATFTPSLNFGPDPEGFDGSTWTFEFNSSQTHYGDFGGFPIIVTDSAFLTVSGATTPGYNGTFAIAETFTTNFANFPRVVANAFFGYSSNLGNADFNFGPGPITVSNLGLQGLALASPNVGDPILLTDWQGASVSNSGVTVGGGNFDFGSGTVNAAVPEPSTTAALAGIAALGFALYRRRKA